MEWYITAGSIFSLLILLLAIGLPVAFSLGLASAIGIWFFIGINGLSQLSTVILHYGTNPGFACLPLFILMAELLGVSGAAGEIFNAIQKMAGKWPGSLAISTIVACAIFAAACGTSTGAAAAMGIIVIPQLLENKYDKALATGTAAAGGTLGILIPPSGIMIIYAVITEQSISELFMAGIVPGIMMTVIFSLYIVIRVKLNPQLAPINPVDVSWKEKINSLKGIWVFMIVIVTVLGSIYFGICTATEAAAIGAFSSFIVTLARKKMNWIIFKETLIRTVRTSCFVFFIIFGAMTFGYLLSYLNIPIALTKLITSMDVSPLVILLMMNVLFIFLGMFLDPAGIIVLTMPLLFPIAMELGFNPIWFGIVMTMNMEMANITPPVGLNLFVIKTISPSNVSLGDIIRGATPYVLLLGLGIILIIIFPGIALWLPNMMMK